MTENKQLLEDYKLLRSDLFKFFPDLKNPFKVVGYGELPNGNPGHVSMVYKHDKKKYTLSLTAMRVGDIAKYGCLSKSKKWIEQNAYAYVWIAIIGGHRLEEGVSEELLCEKTKTGKLKINPLFASMRNAEIIAKQAYSIMGRGE